MNKVIYKSRLSLKVYFVGYILAIQTRTFTNEEYSKVKENLIDGKAAGPDGVAPEI